MLLGRVRCIANPLSHAALCPAGYLTELGTIDKALVAMHSYMSKLKTDSMVQSTLGVFLPGFHSIYILTNHITPNAASAARLRCSAVFVLGQEVL